MKENLDYENNIYIMVPYFLEKSRRFNFNDIKDSEDKLSKFFLKQFEKISFYECNNDISTELKRYFLEKNVLYCFDDKYEDEVKSKETINMFLTRHIISNICLLTIMIRKNKFSTTQIQDQVTSNFLYVDNFGEKIFLDEYVYEKYGLRRCGSGKVLVSLSKMPKDKLEFQYMLAGESFNSSYSNCLLNSEEILINSGKNFSQYDFYEIYAGRNSIVYILKNFNNDDMKNIVSEIPILFIMELVMFQYSSLLRTNIRIVNELSYDINVSLNQIEKLYIEFSKTIKFWARDVFKYPTSQILFDRINKSFENDKILEEYQTNQRFLEHIVSLRDVQHSNRENKILNIIVIILTILQVIPTIISIVSWVHKTDYSSYYYSLIQIFGIISLIIIFIISMIKNNRNKNKKERLN